MKVVVLGGSGQMGKIIVTDLVKTSKQFDEIIIADVAELVKGKDQDDTQGNRGGCPDIRAGQEAAIDQYQQGQTDGEIREDDGGKGDAEEFKEERVIILRQRAGGQIGDVAIKDAAGGADLKLSDRKQVLQADAINIGI